MMKPGKEMQSILEDTMSSRLVCKKCETVFTFEEGAQGPMRVGVQEKVVMCPNCYTVYEVDITPATTTLLEDVTHKFPAIVNKAQQQKQELVRCDVCHQMRQPEGFVCSRCGYVNWRSIGIIWGLTIVLLAMAVFLRQRAATEEMISYLDLALWLFGFGFLYFSISELVKAIRASRK